MFDPATDDPENRRRNMGGMKNYAMDWLERGGDQLGYEISHLPALSDFDLVLQENVTADEYFNNKKWSHKMADPPCDHQHDKKEKKDEHTSKRHRNSTAQK